MVVGENGVLNRATDASQETKEADVKDRVSMEVMGSYDGSGSLNLDDLNNNLMNNLTGVELKDETGEFSALNSGNKIENLPAIVKYNGVEVKIDEKGSVKPAIITVAGTEITKENVREYLGKKVKNYKGQSSVIIDGETYNVSPEYRLCYVDFDEKYGEKGTIYLKAECIDSAYDLPALDTISIDNTKFKTLNPELYKDGKTGPDLSGNNMKATMWLTDTSRWL